ncbi:MAG: phasin family protein [Vicinamibacteria bacterium]
MFPKPIQEQIDRISDTVNRLQKDAEKFQKKLAKRGREAEREGRKQFNKILSDVRNGDVSATLRSTRKQLSKQVERVSSQVLRALEIPTRRDMTALNKKIDVLDKKFNDLRRAVEKPA